MLRAQASDPLLWIIDTAPLILAGFAWAAGVRQDRVITLNRALAERGKDIEAARANLARDVELRTAQLDEANLQLQSRAHRLEQIAQLSQSISQIQNPQALLSSIPRLISETLGYYHIGLFLVDEDGRYATLRAANSPGGQRLLQQGHRLRVGVTGIVGNVARYAHPRVALDVGEDPTFFSNPELPGTHSEVALPLMAGERCLGVLDIQSTERNAFQADEVEALTILTNQLAIAYQNAVQLAEARSAAAAFQTAGVRELEQISRVGGLAGYAARADGRVEPVSGDVPSVLEDALLAGRSVQRPARGDGVQPSLAVPVTLRGDVIGVIQAESADPTRRWSTNEILLLESIAGRAATALENAGLLSRTQRQAEKQKAIGEIAASIGSSTRFDAILETAARELSKALGGSEVMVQIESRNLGSAPKPER